MIPPPTPADEISRLHALRSLQILDTPAEERFDRITRLARHTLGVPIALVSLVDGSRQWFKSRQGLDAAETGRDISFCGHAILGKEMLVVPDASCDSRFSDNPLVVGDPKIRFYAGRPIAAPDGSRVGTLCAIDRRPRTLTPVEQGALHDLAAMVEAEFANVALAEALGLVREREGQLREFLENANDLIQSVDSRGNLLFVNRKWKETLGYTSDDIARLNAFDVIHPDSRDHCAAIFKQLKAGMKVSDIEALFMTRDGRQILVSGNLSCAGEGGEFFTRGIFRDITDRQKAEEALRLMATTDGLTGLWNGSHFRSILTQEISRSRREGQPLSLAMLDLDHFKEINDTHGHDAGDAALVRVAQTLRECLRSSDVIGRYGGDELCVLLLGTESAAAEGLLVQFGRALAGQTLTSKQGAHFQVRCSIGTATLDPGIVDGKALMKRADEALYRAKSAGRNRVVVAPVA